MARDKSVYTCTACGGVSPKWLGKCPHCGEWNTLEESVAEAPAATRHRYKAGASALPVATLSEIEAAEVDRLPTGLAELDRALGGGIVEGGVVLIGGDPGIGKSTLLLQAAERLAQRIKVLDGRVPGSMELKMTQREVQPPEDPLNVVAVIRGVIAAEQAAIDQYQRIIEVTDVIDPVTQDLCITLKGDEEEHKRLFKGFLAEAKSWTA